MQPHELQQYAQMLQLGQKPDEGLNVTFYEGSKRSAKESDAAGRDVFVPVVMVRIIIPGNKDEIIDDEAKLHDTHIGAHNVRFPFAWSRFQQQAKGDGVVGFPLKEWAGITRSMADTLSAINIQSVEQLAALSDGYLQNVHLPNPAELRQKARDFLSQAATGHVLQVKLMALEAELAALKQSAAPLPKVTVIPQAATAAVVGVGTPEPDAGLPIDRTVFGVPEAPPRRRGRPPKAQQPQT